MATKIEDALWDVYHTTRMEADRNRLVEHYLPIVQKIAKKSHRSMPGSVELDDLVTTGAIGLIQAVESFDRSRKTSFVTYCQRRIHGAIRDELREVDWVPRLARQREAILDRVVQSLRSRGLEATKGRVCGRLHLTTPEYDRLIKDGATRSMTEGSVVDGGTEPGSYLSAQKREPPPETKVVDCDSLSCMVKGLPSRERSVVLLWLEGLYQWQISRSLGVSESRVSQLLKSSLQQMRAKFQGSRDS